MSSQLSSHSARLTYPLHHSSETLMQAAVYECTVALDRELRDALADDDGGTLEAMLGGLNDTDVVAAAWRHRELIRVFVASEFDRVTPGKRGLGRMQTGVGDSWARLGAIHGSKIGAEDERFLGEQMEAMLIAGMVSAAAFIPLLTSGPYPVRERTDDEVFDRWVPIITSGYDPSVDLMGFMMDVLLFDDAGPAYGLKFLERMKQLGAVKGLGKTKKEASLAIRCALYFSAGLSLLDATTDRLKR